MGTTLREGIEQEHERKFDAPCRRHRYFHWRPYIGSNII